MKTKRLSPDYSSIEDERKNQKVNRAAKVNRPDKGYKEDPETVRARLDISRSFQDSIKGKSDKQRSLAATMHEDELEQANMTKKKLQRKKK